MAKLKEILDAESQRATLEQCRTIRLYPEGTFLRVHRGTDPVHRGTDPVCTWEPWPLKHNASQPPPRDARWGCLEARW